MFKCLSKRSAAYVVGILFTISYTGSLLVGILVPYWAEEYFFLFEPSPITRVVLLTLKGGLLGSCILLLIGIRKERHVPILCWIVLSFLHWNGNLTLSLLGFFTYVTSKRFRGIGESLVRTFILAAVQVTWFFLIVTVWRYWKTLTLIRDLPSYIEYLKGRRTPPQNTHTAQNPTP